MFKLLQHSHAQRAEYLRVCHVYDLRRSASDGGWKMSLLLSEQLIKWDDLIKLIQVFLSKYPSNQPKDMSFDNLKPETFWSPYTYTFSETL